MKEEARCANQSAESTKGGEECLVRAEGGGQRLQGTEIRSEKGEGADWGNEMQEAGGGTGKEKGANAGGRQ